MAGKDESRTPGVSRRRFIRASGLAGSAALVGACSRTPPPLRRLAVRGACHHDCPDTCAWVVATEDGRAVAHVLNMPQVPADQRMNLLRRE